MGVTKLHPEENMDINMLVMSRTTPDILLLLNILAFYMGDQAVF